MTVIIKTKFTNQISLTNYLNQINYSDTVMVTEVVILFYTSNHLGYKPLLFHYTTSTRSSTLRHLFATLFPTIY